MDAMAIDPGRFCCRSIEPIPDWHETIVSQRLAKLERGEDTLLNWDDAKQQLKNLLKLRD